MLNNEKSLDFDSYIKKRRKTIKRDFCEHSGIFFFSNEQFTVIARIGCSIQPRDRYDRGVRVVLSETRPDERVKLQPNPWHATTNAFQKHLQQRSDQLNKRPSHHEKKKVHSNNFYCAKLQNLQIRQKLIYFCFWR